MLREYLAKVTGILGLGIQLAKANFKLKNEGSFIGIFWYLLEPFFLFIIILGIMTAFGRVDDSHYPLYLLLGLVMYNFFSVTTSISTGVITDSSDFIKSIKINHESLIISRVLEGIFSHFFEILLFIGFMIYFKIPLIWILVYPFLFVFFVLFVLGLSFLLATLGIYILDIRNAWRVVTTLLFFVTPIFYIAEKGTLFYKINLFNPVFYFISVAREFIVYNKIPEYWIIGTIIGIGALFFLIGVAVFENYKNRFAEFV